MKCVNIKLWDILGCFHNILNAPRIYNLMYFPLFVGFLCLSLFCSALLCVHSSVCKHLEEEKKACFFAIIVLHIYSYYKCFMDLPCAMAWSAVCDCGIS